MSSNSQTIEPEQSYFPPGRGQDSQDLSKFKPWVFRPKKVKFGLEDAPPTRKSYSTSHWTAEENSKYVSFLTRFRQVLEGEKQRRRKWHLNRIMSKHIGTRSHEQCRSHHQKMIKHYKNINGIIEHLTNTPLSTQDSTSERREEVPEPQPQGQESYYDVLELDEPQPNIPLPWFDPESFGLI